MRFFSMTCAQQCLWLAISHPMDSPSLPIKISTKIPAASLLSPSFLPLDPFDPPFPWIPARLLLMLHLEKKVQIHQWCWCLHVTKPPHIFNEVFSEFHLVATDVFVGTVPQFVAHIIVIGTLPATASLCLMARWERCAIWCSRSSSCGCGKRDQESLNFVWYIRHVGYLCHPDLNLQKTKKRNQDKTNLPRSLRV